MSKKTVKRETMTLWLTRSRSGVYDFWLAKPRKCRDGEWDYCEHMSKCICSAVFHRRFPKAWQLAVGGGPLECLLTVKGKA